MATLLIGLSAPATAHKKYRQPVFEQVVQLGLQPGEPGACRTTRPRPTVRWAR
jgi:hypothetical protein